MLKDFSGPYPSCHNLSLLWKIDIKGDMKLVGITDKKCVNHREMDEIPILIYFFLLNWSINPRNVPEIKITKILILLLGEIRNNCSDETNHVSHDPEVIAIILRIMMGIKQFKDWWFDVKGWDKIWGLFENKVMRMEYDAVIPIDNIIKVDRVKFKLDIIINSIITSFEKNPDMNGIPISAILLIPRMDNIKG